MKSDDPGSRKLSKKWKLLELSAEEKRNARGEAIGLIEIGRKLWRNFDAMLSTGQPVNLFPKLREEFDLDYVEKFDKK